MCSAVYVLSSILTACRSEPPSVHAVAGCWAFERRDHGSRPLGAEMPDTLELSTEIKLNPDGQPYPRFPQRVVIHSRNPDTGRDTLRLDSTHAVPWPVDWPNHYALTVWRFAAPDSISIMLHANMDASWMIQLRPLGPRLDSLAGYAEYYSDVVLPQPRRIPLVARRTACQLRSPTVT
jgi:hypothetical protein